MTNTYRQRITAIENFSFENLLKDCKSHVPSEFKWKPYRHPELQHGVTLLQSDEALDCYMSAYGEMHYVKCCAALQNFPFDKLLSPQYGSSAAFEIVDWGCGQGIGSLAIIEVFKQRNLLKWLKKVTLIEPGEAAIHRARENVMRALNSAVPVNTIPEYLPSVDTDKEVLGVNYTYNHVIHIFSNILDVPTIDLGKLAKSVATTGNNHFVLCAGPLNANAFRMDRFCQIFGDQPLFSNISSGHYACTSDTHYPFTCKTKCFAYDGGSLNLSAYNPHEQAKEEALPEYSPLLLAKNEVMTLMEARVYYRLLQITNQDDIIYIKPELNGVKPDFVICRPRIGVLLIEVVEEDVKSLPLEKPKKQDSSNEVDPLTDEGDSKYCNPITLLNRYQDIFIESLEELTMAIIESNKNFCLVKKVLICANNTKEESIERFGKNLNYTNVYGKEFIFECPKLDLYNDIKFTYRNGIFTDSVLKKLLRMISPEWHSCREGKNITLTRAQMSLAMSSANTMQKVSGVAGAGKTQVMCTRAVNAIKRTGGRVLILTFNITLVNYLKIRLSEIREDFSWNSIKLDYYHRFFREIAHSLLRKVHFESYDDLTFFDDVKDRIEKYDAVFIDEIQDYKTVWLELIKKVFLKEDGELVVFGDPSQNIYGRELDSNGDIRIGVIPGSWNRTLSRSQRFSNPILSKFAFDFQKTFNFGQGFPESPSSPFSTELSFHPITYDYIEESDSMEETAKRVYELSCSLWSKLQQDAYFNMGDIAVISATKDILSIMDYLYRNDKQDKTTCTFPNIETCRKIIDIHRKLKPNLDVKKDFALKRDLERIARHIKKKFTTDTPHLKFATIQSFKGWDAQTVILVIMPDTQYVQMHGSHDGEEEYTVEPLKIPELIYTGITRSRENLYIINVGNKKYDSFFRERIG